MTLAHVILKTKLWLMELVLVFYRVQTASLILETMYARLVHQTAKYVHLTLASVRNVTQHSLLTLLRILARALQVNSKLI